MSSADRRTRQAGIPDRYRYHISWAQLPDASRKNTKRMFCPNLNFFLWNDMWLSFYQTNGSGILNLASQTRLQQEWSVHEAAHRWFTHSHQMSDRGLQQRHRAYDAQQVHGVSGAAGFVQDRRALLWAEQGQKPDRETLQESGPARHVC